MQQSEGTAITADLVRRFYDVVWNKADENGAFEILHPNFKFHASLGPERQGLDGFINYMRAIHAALGNYVCTLDELIVDGVKAAARLSFPGRHEDEFFCVAGTGRPITGRARRFLRPKQQLGVDARRTF